MISFREGLEAFLIVAIVLTYLTKIGGKELIPFVKSATIIAILGCIGLGILLAKIGALTSFWEGTLALTAAVLVISCTVHMLRTGNRMKSEITGAIDRAAQNPSSGAKLAIFLFVLLMIGREGLEAATMIASLVKNNDNLSLAIGGVMGIFIAGLVAIAWSKYGYRINLNLFFKVTAAFMIVFSIQLIIYAFHEYTESIEIANLGIIDNAYWHAATEAYGPQGRIGAWISYSLVLVPLAFLIFSFVKNPQSAKRQITNS